MSDIVSYTVPVTSDGTTTDTTLYFKDGDLREDVEKVKEYIGYVPPKVIGLQADFENSTFTRLGDAVGLSAGSDFDQFPMYGGRRLCNLADDGTVNAWYGDAGYTEDGSNGQVMVWQPKFYYKVEPLKIQAIEKDAETDQPEGYHLLKANYYICAEKKGGFKLHPAFFDGNGNEVDGIYISAYEGSIFDVSENKYLIYNDMEPVGDGTYTRNAYSVNINEDKLSSIANVKPASGNDRTVIKAIAQNRGSRWHGETIQVVSMEQLLMIIEYAIFNMQVAIGDGVTNISITSGQNDSVQTGATSSLGESTGVATSTDVYVSIGHVNYTTASGLDKMSVRYRGRENDWGNINKHINGINMWGDGKRKGGIPYYCSDFDFYDSRTSLNYTSAGITLSNRYGYIQYFGWSELCDWMFMPTMTGGNTVVPIGDRLLSESELGSPYRYRRVTYGGYTYSGTEAGLFYWNTLTSPSSDHGPSIGARLFFV